jgi:hypothetical protein
VLIPSQGALEIEQGVNCELVFDLFNDDAQTERTPLVGYHAVLQARRRRGDTTPILNVSSAGPNPKLFIETAIDGPPGQWIRLHLNAADTLAIQTEGRYSLVLVSDTDSTDVIPIYEDDLVLEKKLVQV